jgi:hypothetical protein
LSVIHEFYEIYEATQAGKEDDQIDMDIDEDGTYSMGDGIWFEGLAFVSPGIWCLLLGS